MMSTAMTTSMTPTISAVVSVAAAATTWDHWLYLIVPFALYVVAVLALALAGAPSDRTDVVSVLCLPISSSLRRLTGYPGWTMAGVLTGLFLLGIALVGLYWDVAFHIDYGRDDNLFTPSHTMIVLALGGLVVTAGVVVLFATLEHAQVGKRVMGLHVPWSAVVLGALGLGGLVAFPLDNLWHIAFGVDVTLWSPTHLMLVSGGGLAPIALWLMLVEGRAGATPTLLARVVEVVVFGAILTGLTAYQGEFDFGVPQFQVVYLPVLAAIAAGFALVLARAALGRGGAFKAVLAFLVLRGIVALLVGGALNHTVPRFPLYVAAAVAVEVAGYWLGTERRLRFALVSGALVGTVGLAGEIPLVAALHWFPVAAAVLPKAAVLAPLAAMAAAVMAMGMSRAGAIRRPEADAVRAPSGRHEVVGAWSVVVGLIALAVVLAYPLPRRVGDVQAVVRLDRVGDLANVEVELQPPGAATVASAFGVVSWQGGGRVLAELRQVGPGRYQSSQPVPVTGSWKSMVGLQRGDQVMAAPIYLPADAKIGASAVPALPTREVAFVRNTDILLREAHDGPAGPAIAAYSGLAVVVAGWVALFALIAARLSATPAKPSARANIPTAEKTRSVGAPA